MKIKIILVIVIASSAMLFSSCGAIMCAARDAMTDYYYYDTSYQGVYPSFYQVQRAYGGGYYYVRGGRRYGVDLGQCHYGRPVYAGRVVGPYHR